MITVHHLNNSRSQRILWLLEELEIPYEVKRYERNPKTMLAPAELRAIHPLGKSPVITDGDITVAESGAIIEYILDRYDMNGRLRPAAGTKDRLRFSYWLHYAEGSVMPLLVMSLVLAQIPKAKMPFFIKPIARSITDNVMKIFVSPQLKQHLGFMETELSHNQWFAGSTFSAADIQMSFPVEAADSRAQIGPHLKTYLNTIHSRAAYKKALEKGRPYELLK